MSSKPLTDAIRALIPSSFDHYESEVRGKQPPLPWVVSAISIPGADHLSEARTVNAGNLTVHLTFAGENEDSVRVLMDATLPNFQGQRVGLPGYQLGVFIQTQRPRIYPDDVNLDGASRHLIVGTVAFTCTVSRKAA